MVDRGLVDVYFLHAVFEPAPALSAHMGVGFFYFRSASRRSGSVRDALFLD